MKNPLLDDRFGKPEIQVYYGDTDSISTYPNLFRCSDDREAQLRFCTDRIEHLLYRMSYLCKRIGSAIVCNDTRVLDTLKIEYFKAEFWYEKWCDLREKVRKARYPGDVVTKISDVFNGEGENSSDEVLFITKNMARCKGSGEEIANLKAQISRLTDNTTKLLLGEGLVIPGHQMSLENTVQETSVVQRLAIQGDADGIIIESPYCPGMPSKLVLKNNSDKEIRLTAWICYAK